MLRLAFLFCVSPTIAQYCRSPINVRTTGNEVEPRQLEDIVFKHYDEKAQLNATFHGGEAQIYGFNASTAPPSISGAGLDQPHVLVEVRVFGSSRDDASVHSVDGFRSAFELLLVQRSESGSTAVVAVLGETRPAGICVTASCSKESLDAMIEALKQANVKREPTEFSFKPSSLLPTDSRPYYAYNGTAIGNCQQNVRYYLLKVPLKLPQARMRSFRTAFSDRRASRPAQVQAGNVYRRCCL